MSERSNTLMRSLLYWFLGVIGFLTTVILFYAGPVIEVLLYPVITKFEVTDVWIQTDENGQDMYYAQGVLIKARGECVPQSLTMKIEGDVNDVNSKFVKIDFEPDPIHRQGVSNELRSRPDGPQHWGPWELFPPNPPLGPIISVSVSHKCHFIWNTRQTIFQGLTERFFPKLYSREDETNDIPPWKKISPEPGGGPP